MVVQLFGSEREKQEQEEKRREVENKLHAVLTYVLMALFGYVFLISIFGTFFCAL